jgi:hypothetical protein
MFRLRSPIQIHMLNQSFDLFFLPEDMAMTSIAIPTATMPPITAVLIQYSFFSLSTAQVTRGSIGLLQIGKIL